MVLVICPRLVEAPVPLISTTTSLVLLDVPFFERRSYLVLLDVVLC